MTETRGRKKTTSAEKRKNPDYRPDRDGYGGIKLKGDANDAPDKPDFKAYPVAGQFWDYVVPMLQDSGLAVRLDTTNLTALCEFYAMWRFAVDTRAKVLDVKRAYEMFDSVASKFGMTPKDRQKLREWQPPKEEDEFDNFLSTPVEVTIA